MVFWRNRVGIQSGPSRDPVGTQSGTNFSIFGHRFFGIQSGSSRDPVGHQFSNFWHHVWTCREAAKSPKKHAKTLQKCYFLCVWLPPDIGARLVIPTGSRLDPDWPKAVPKNAKIGARLGPDGIPTRSRLIHRSARTHSRTYFSLPRPTLAPIFLFRAPAVHQYPPPLLHQNGKSSLKPNGGSTSMCLQFGSIPLFILNDRKFYSAWHFSTKKQGSRLEHFPAKNNMCVLKNTDLKNGWPNATI